MIMLKLLKIEWLKLRHYRTFWVLGILYMVSVFAAGYIGYRIERNTLDQSKELKMIAGTSFSFPDVWQSVSWLSSLLVFLPALLIVTFVTNEFVYKTHRQNIIDGWSRSQFISVKIVLVVLLAIASTFMVFLTSVLIGLMGDRSFSFEDVQYVAYYFVQAVSYNSLALLCAVLLKRTGLALGIFLAYAYFLENLIGNLLNWKIESKPGNYLPLNATDNLIPFPFIKNVTKQILSTPDAKWLLVFAGVYLAAYLWITVKRFRTEDL